MNAMLKYLRVVILNNIWEYSSHCLLYLESLDFIVQPILIA